MNTQFFQLDFSIPPVCDSKKKWWGVVLFFLVWTIFILPKTRKGGGAYHALRTFRLLSCSILAGDIRIFYVLI